MKIQIVSFLCLAAISMSASAMFKFPPNGPGGGNVNNGPPNNRSAPSIQVREAPPTPPYLTTTEDFGTQQLVELYSALQDYKDNADIGRQQTPANKDAFAKLGIYVMPNRQQTIDVMAAVWKLHEDKKQQTVPAAWNTNQLQNLIDASANERTNKFNQDMAEYTARQEARTGSHTVNEHNRRMHQYK